MYAMSIIVLFLAQAHRVLNQVIVNPALAGQTVYVPHSCNNRMYICLQMQNAHAYVKHLGRHEHVSTI